MKAYKSGLIFNWYNSWILAVMLVVLAAVTTAKGETNTQKIAQAPSIPSSVTNGLFTPTQADRFFQTGRENFAREVEIFNHPERYLSDQLLQLDPEIIEHLNQYQSGGDFKPNNAQYDLHRDGANAPDRL